VIVLRGCQVSRELVRDVHAFGAECGERVAQVAGRPQHRGVRDQGEAQRLVDLVLEVATPDVALVGEEQVTAQRVQALPLIELATHSPAQFFVGDVAADVDGAHEPAVFVERFGEAALSAAGVQLGDEQAGGGVPELHRRDQQK